VSLRKEVNLRVSSLGKEAKGLGVGFGERSQPDRQSNDFFRAHYPFSGNAISNGRKRPGKGAQGTGGPATEIARKNGLMSQNPDGVEVTYLAV